MPNINEYARVCSALRQRLDDILAGRQMRFMEVCGTHTQAIFQSGLRAMLPAGIKHISGPGCPVCVTHESEVALFLQLAQNRNVIITTFGDLMRVPGPQGQSLKHAQAAGANIRIVYSPLDALTVARNNPQKEVVFLGVGFETTAPTVAAAILSAARMEINNFSVLSLHKLVPPVLHALLDDPKFSIDAFLLPGHVATITGTGAFAFLAQDYAKPAAIGGFEAADILLALCSMATQFTENRAEVANMYPRAVDDDGNPRARELMAQVFAPADALWRGIGTVAQSGLVPRPEFARQDAMKKLDLALPDVEPIRGCLCGSVLKGQIEPPQCPLFGKKCTPAEPVGPCMVSSEGSCAAYFKYGDY